MSDKKDVGLQVMMTLEERKDIHAARLDFADVRVVPRHGRAGVPDDATVMRLKTVIGGLE